MAVADQIFDLYSLVVNMGTCKGYLQSYNLKYKKGKMRKNNFQENIYILVVVGAPTYNGNCVVLTVR